MYKKMILPLIIAGMMLGGCGNKKNKEEAAATAASTPKIKVTEGVVKKSTKKYKSEANSGQFYYSYNKEKNTTKEQKTRTTIDAYLHIHSPYERIRITMMIKKLSKDFVVRCSPCHDDYANGVIGPSLLGKDGKFIYGRLIAFKTGKKKNVLMKQLVDQMSDDQLKKMANEIATFNKQIQKMREEQK